MDIKLVVTGRDMKAYKIPIIIPVLLFPIGHVLVILAIIMWIMGFRFSFIRESDPNVSVEAVFSKLRDKVNEAGRKY